MFGIFKKKTRKAITEVKKMENRDAVEATVWGAYSIAFADGTCDAKEIAVLEKTIAALPAFAPFSGEIAQMSANIRARYEASPRSANAQALRELADVAGIRAAITAELRSFLLRDGYPQGELKVSRISEAISGANGEYSHQLLAPADNISIAKNELAVLGTISWT